MENFLAILSSKKIFCEALRSIQLTAKEMESLAKLYAAKDGIPISRDAGNRVRGDTVHHSSKIGRYLTQHFHNMGPQDSMLWLGTLKRGTDGKEYWVMRPDVRDALDDLGWF